MEMENKTIKELVNKLSWNYPDDVQKKSISSLANLGEQYLDSLFDPLRKDTWENYVKVVELVGFPENERAIPRLLWLLMDMNWPGAEAAMNLLCSFKRQTIILEVEKVIIEAYEKEDYMWLYGLKTLVDKVKLQQSDFFNKKTYDFLKYADF